MTQKLRIAGFMALIACMAAVGLPAARADDEDRRHDHDVARQGLQQNEILPLETVLASIRQRVPGDIAGIELEHEGGEWLYEIKVISPAGVMQELEVDARSGAILTTKGK